MGRNSALTQSRRLVPAGDCRATGTESPHGDQGAGATSAAALSAGLSVCHWSSGGSILDSYKPKIHALLAEDPKRRAVCILELIEPDGYSGKIGLVRNFVREIRPLYQSQRVFLRV
jgi:hypothetical protein